MPIMVEVVDESQPVIGGEDFHWATALVDAKGTLVAPAAKTGDALQHYGYQLAVYSPNGTKKSCWPCDISR